MLLESGGDVKVATTFYLTYYKNLIEYEYMKIRMLKNKRYKFGLYLAKGEVRTARLNNGIYQTEANQKNSGIWLALNRKDFEII